MPEQVFQPEWFSKPGDTLRTLLDRRDLSPVALAECMGRDASVVHGLLSGSVAIDDSLAGLLAGCVGGSATFWTTSATTPQHGLTLNGRWLSVG